jgi:hypothetical protein
MLGWGLLSDGSIRAIIEATIPCYKLKKWFIFHEFAGNRPFAIEIYRIKIIFSFVAARTTD